MNRVSTTAWVLCVAPVVVAGILYAHRHSRFRRLLEKMQHATRAIDANMAEIQRLREDQSRRSDADLARRVRREFENIDLAALAAYLNLDAESPKR